MGKPAWASNPLALTKAQASLLIKLGAPLLLLHICDFVATVSSGPRDLDVLDCFSGGRSIYSAFGSEGCRGQYFEIEDRGDRNDLTSVWGFITAVKDVLSVKENGLMAGGPPCGPWIWINAATHCRKKCAVFGDTTKKYVQASNTLVCRWAMLLLLAGVRCIYTISEQPSSSLMPRYDYIKYVKTILYTVLGCPWLEVPFYMGAHGHFSLKPTKCWGTAIWGQQLKRKVSKAKREALRKSGKGMVKLSTSSSGKKQVTGGKLLKKSAEYPRLFGKRVAKLHLKHIAENAGELRKAVYGRPVEELPQVKRPHNWNHADLKPIRQFLREEVQKGTYRPVL